MDDLTGVFEDGLQLGRILEINVAKPFATFFNDLQIRRQERDPKDVGRFLKRILAWDFVVFNVFATERKL